VQADHAAERAEIAERKNKALELLLLQKEQEIESFTHRNGTLEAQVEKMRDNLKSSEIR
jgi:tropomyosin